MRSMLLVYALIEHSQADEDLARKHGCLPIKATFPCKWPLGFDVLYAQYKAIKRQQIPAFQQPFLDDLGPNLEIKILGTPGYTTFDPENVETVLSSRFQGTLYSSQVRSFS